MSTNKFTGKLINYFVLRKIAFKKKKKQLGSLLVSYNQKYDLVHLPIMGFHLHLFHFIVDLHFNQVSSYIVDAAARADLKMSALEFEKW